MTTPCMHLKILLPFEVFEDKKNVIRIVAESHEGSFGLLPQRLDCVVALIPGILTLVNESEETTFVAVDSGTLIKFNSEVLVSVRRAHVGDDLNQLREAVEKQYIELDDEEKSLRSVLRKMESGFLNRFEELQRE